MAPSGAHVNPERRFLCPQYVTSQLRRLERIGWGRLPLGSLQDPGPAGSTFHPGRDPAPVVTTTTTAADADGIAWAEADPPAAWAETDPPDDAWAEADPPTRRAAKIIASIETLPGDDGHVAIALIGARWRSLIDRRTCLPARFPTADIARGAAAIAAHVHDAGGHAQHWAYC